MDTTVILAQPRVSRLRADAVYVDCSGSRGRIPRSMESIRDSWRGRRLWQLLEILSSAGLFIPGDVPHGHDVSHGPLNTADPRIPIGIPGSDMLGGGYVEREREFL